MTCARRWLAAFAFVLAMSGVGAQLHATPCALPDDVDLGGVDAALLAAWTAQERWVWSKAIAGETADFNTLYCAVLQPADDDPGWHDATRPRGLSQAFLLSILRSDQLGGRLPVHGVRITGARFDSDLDLDGVTFPRWLGIDGSRFEGGVSLEGARIASSLSAVGSSFGGAVNMRGLGVDQGLYLRDAKFAGALALFGAEIGGNLELINSDFRREVRIEATEVREYLHLHGAVFHDGILLFYSRIGAALIARGATFNGVLDGTAMSVQGEFTLDSEFGERGTAWGRHGRLVLRNAHVGALQDRRDSWPPKGYLELEGFRYDRLGGLGAGGGSETSSREPEWYVDWLARDVSFAPQPYQQLAGILREMGDGSRANAVLWAARERERATAWENDAVSRWLGLSLLKWTVGYGIGLGYFRVLVWVAGVAGVGAVILWWRTSEARSRGWLWCAWASLDWMLPFVDLDDEHKKVVSQDPSLSGWRHWFYVQAIAGYLLAGFLGAGLAGLTQGL
jgi:hypothetical protein